MSFLLIAMIVMTAGWYGVAALARYASERSQVRRQLADVAHHAIASFPEGTPGRIVGRVVADETIEAPLTGRACVFYEVIVEETDGNVAERRVLRETGGVAFVVDDRTGRAIVEADRARVSLRRDAYSETGMFQTATTRERALLARHGQRSTGWVFERKLRFIEARIEPGETVVVAGIGVREPDPEAPPGEGYREGPPTRLRLNGSRNHPLLVSDAPETA